jgi:hypothetical protein
VRRWTNEIIEAVPENTMLGTCAFEALAYGLRPAFAFLEGGCAKSANVCVDLEEGVYKGMNAKRRCARIRASAFVIVGQILRTLK